jgi:hypothetical protein
VTARARRGGLTEATHQRAGRVGYRRDRPRSPDVVTGPLIRPKQEPSFRGLRPDFVQRRNGGRRRRRSNAEEDRAGGVGGDEQATRVSVETEEQFRVPLHGAEHRVAVDPPIGSPSARMSVGDDLPGRVPAGPRDCRRRPDLAHSRGGGLNEGVGLLEHLLYFAQRDDSANGLPVQRGGGPSTENEKRRVGAFIPEGGTPQDGGPKFVREVPALRFRQVARERIASDHSFRTVPHYRGRSSTMREARDKSGVPPRFGRDVGIEANQSRLSDQVEAQPLGRPDDLGEGEGRAPAARAVGVVYPDPDDGPTPDDGLDVGPGGGGN